jgi:hypothetical protein
MGLGVSFYLHFYLFTQHKWVEILTDATVVQVKVWYIVPLISAVRKAHQMLWKMQ